MTKKRKNSHTLTKNRHLSKLHNLLKGKFVNRHLQILMEMLKCMEEWLLLLLLSRLMNRIRHIVQALQMIMLLPLLLLVQPMDNTTLLPLINRLFPHLPILLLPLLLLINTINSNNSTHRQNRNNPKKKKRMNSIHTYSLNICRHTKESCHTHIIKSVYHPRIQMIRLFHLF